MPPLMPKSLGLRKNGCPKWCIHTRFTMTRAVRALSSDAIQLASAKRRSASGASRASSNSVSRAESVLKLPGATSGPSFMGSPRSITKDGLSGCSKRPKNARRGLGRFAKARCASRSVCSNRSHRTLSSGVNTAWSKRRS